MNKLKFLSTIIFFVLLIISCSEEFLNPVQTDSFIQSNYYKTDAPLLTGLPNMYDAIQGANELEQAEEQGQNQVVQYEFYLTEMRSDNTRTKSSEGEAAQFEKYNVCLLYTSRCV